MGSITSSGNPPDSSDKPAIRAALEGGVAAMAAAAAVQAGLVRPELRGVSVRGLVLAWVACSAGAVLLALGKARGQRWFWRAFGMGVAIRAGVLAWLMADAWRRPVTEAWASLGSYVFGLALMMLLEFRHLSRMGAAGRSKGQR